MHYYGSVNFLEQKYEDSVAHTCAVLGERTHFSSNSKSSGTYLLYVQSYIHVRKWIFCKQPWMSKLLKIRVLYLNVKLATFRRSVNCQVRNKWSSRNAHHVYQYLLHENKVGNRFAGSRMGIFGLLFYNESFQQRMLRKIVSCTLSNDWQMKENLPVIDALQFYKTYD